MRAEKGLLFVGVICCYNMPGGAKAASYVTVSEGNSSTTGAKSEGKSVREKSGRKRREGGARRRGEG